jgi:hypothetical protein
MTQKTEMGETPQKRAGEAESGPLTVTSYSIVDHGIENSQYFQGCGVAFTPYSDVVTGCGNDFREAFQDALESMAQCGVDTEAFEALVRSEGHDIEQAGGDVVPEDSEDTYYYVSIRWVCADSPQSATGEVRTNG